MIPALTPRQVHSFEIQVVRSARRTKSVQAQLCDGRLKISIPAAMSAREEHEWVERMAARMRRTRTSAHIDLSKRAAALASRHGLAVPTRIVWSSRQNERWGSCTPSDGSVRISDRVADMPDWVLDYVIVHELAHLDEPGHGPRFLALVERYELAERARGYLIARSDGT